MSCVKKNDMITARALIFDMDGVITDTMPYHYQAWQTAFHEILNVDIDERDIYLREGSKGAFALEEIFAQHGWPCNGTILDDLLKRKEQIFSNIVKIDFIPGALDFLSCHHRAGFLLGLVTGTSRQEVDNFLPKHIREYFSVIITGSDVAQGKPHPEPYTTALRMLGIGCGDAIVLENAPLGIASARMAGLRCIALATSLPVEFLSEADYIFYSYDELNRALSFVCTKD